MKRTPFILTVLSVAVMISACQKEQAGAAADRAVVAHGIHPSSPVLSGVLGTGHTIRDTIHLTAGTNWQLSGLVYVDDLDVLVIDACCVIKGLKSTTPGVPGGGLVITRGGKIQAQGTSCNPIIFTSAEATPQSGDWSGIIILGNASANTPGRVSVEGIPLPAVPDVLTAVL